MEFSLLFINNSKAIYLNASDTTKNIILSLPLKNTSGFLYMCLFVAQVKSIAK